MVAPSFKDYKRLSEPFLKGDKYYVTVEHPSTKNPRDVRWYSESEYAKAYAKVLADEYEASKQKYGGLKHARGFDNGPVLCVRGDRPDDDWWLRQSCFRYAGGMGWYLVSTDTIPADIPNHFTLVAISWDESKVDDDHMKSFAELDAIIRKKLKTGTDIIRAAKL